MVLFAGGDRKGLLPFIDRVGEIIPFPLSGLPVRSEDDAFAAPVVVVFGDALPLDDGPFPVINVAAAEEVCAL